MINIIYLAGGNSIRFGTNKLLYKINGRRLFEYGLTTLKKLKNTRVIVVTQYDDIYRFCSEHQIVCVLSEKCKNGISESIKEGIKSIEVSKYDSDYKNNEGIFEENRYIMFCAADQPYIKEATLQNYIDEFVKSKKGIGTFYIDDLPSNPTIFSYKYLNDLKKLSGDYGGRNVINNNIDDCFIYYLNNINELKDIDCKEDL